MKYSKWIGLAACIALMVAAFLPWTYHADVQRDFTGFYSHKNTYGTPGKYLVFFSLVSIVLLFLPRIWAKRVQLFVAGILVAYSIKTYILYTSCYNAYCPDKKTGIYLVVILPVIIFIASLFPQLPVPSKKETLVK